MDLCWSKQKQTDIVTAIVAIPISKSLLSWKCNELLMINPIANIDIAIVAGSCYDVSRIWIY